MRSFRLLLAAPLLSLLLLSGCRPEGEGRVPTWFAPAGARTPAQAVLLPTRRLRENDLAAFARDTVPPRLHARLQAAWRQGRTRWPLDELPFDERLPGLLGALAAPGAERTLQQGFDRQFAGQAGELKAAAAALGQFGAQYLEHEGDFSAAERAHYAQVVQALSRWAGDAPLGDARHARSAIARLARAARETRLASEADFAAAGMQASLRRLSPFAATLKQVLAGYGLRVDETLAGLQASELDRKGNRARVRMRYTLGGRPVDAVVEVERVGGRWYLSDFLRHAEAAVAAAPVPPGQAGSGPPTAKPPVPGPAVAR